ncbi:MAG TPA: hypothetical protein VFR02_03535, partial [bacterium]|nr:hypothetical protein [bacterium]
GGWTLAEPGYSRLLAEQHGFQAVSGWGWIALPWRLLMGSPDDYNFAGPLALAAAPFLFFRRFRHPLLGFWARACVLYFVFGLAFTHILRFMVPVFVLFAALAACFFAGSGPRWSRGISWGAALAGGLCFFYLAAICAFYDGCAGIWWGKQTRAQYLSGPGKITPYAPMARWVSENLPSDARLLVVGDARGLYYGRPFLTNSVFDEQVLAQAARGSKDAFGIRERLRRLGVTHLAVNGLEGMRVGPDYGHYDLPPEAWARLDDFFKTWTQRVYDQGFLQVYALRPEAQGPGPWEGEPMPLLFFTGPGRAVVEDDRRQDWGALEGDLRGALALYPGCVFWHEQEALAAAGLGRGRDAEKLFVRAEAMGPLTPVGYLAWARNARSLGAAAESARVMAKARRLYPALEDVQP